MDKKQLLLCTTLIALAFVLSACHRHHHGPGHLVPTPGHLK